VRDFRHYDGSGLFQIMGDQGGFKSRVSSELVSILELPAIWR